MRTLSVEPENDRSTHNLSISYAYVKCRAGYFRHNLFIFVLIRIKETPMTKKNFMLHWKYGPLDLYATFAQLDVYARGGGGA